MQQTKKYQRAVLLWAALIDAFLFVSLGDVYFFIVGYSLLVVAIAFALDTRKETF